MDDSRSRRDNFEVVESGLSPAQELVSFTVALVFDLDVALECVFAAKQVRNDRVVDNEFSRSERVDLFGVSAQIGDRFSHGGEVDDARDSGEVLHHDTGRCELNFGVGFGVCIPAPECTNLCRGDVRAVLGAKEVLQKDLQAIRETGVSLDRVESKNRVITTLDGQGGLGTERINAHSKTLLTRDNSPILIQSAVPSGQLRRARNASSTTSPTTALHTSADP